MQQFSHDSLYNICTFSIDVLKDSSQNKKTNQNTWNCLDHLDSCYSAPLSCSYLGCHLWEVTMTKSSTQRSPSPMASPLSPCWAPLSAGCNWCMATIPPPRSYCSRKRQETWCSVGVALSHQEAWNSEFWELGASMETWSQVSSWRDSTTILVWVKYFSWATCQKIPCPVAKWE